MYRPHECDKTLDWKFNRDIHYYIEWIQRKIETQSQTYIAFIIETVQTFEPNQFVIDFMRQKNKKKQNEEPDFYASFNVVDVVEIYGKLFQLNYCGAAAASK